jgi:hypothetical protein
LNAYPRRPTGSLKCASCRSMKEGLAAAGAVQQSLGSCSRAPVSDLSPLGRPRVLPVPTRARLSPVADQSAPTRWKRSPSPKPAKCPRRTSGRRLGYTIGSCAAPARVEEQHSRLELLLLVHSRSQPSGGESAAFTRKRKPLRRRLVGHRRLGWGPDKAARPNSIDAVATLVAVSSSKPANALASLGPAEVRAPSRR